MQHYYDIYPFIESIAREREESYGSVEDNFDKIQKILLEAFGRELSLEAICDVMIATKLARELNQHKDDNLDDLINYIAIKKFLISKSV